VLYNIGGVDVHLSGANTTVAEVADPGNDCDSIPTLTVGWFRPTTSSPSWWFDDHGGGAPNWIPAPVELAIFNVITNGDAVLGGLPVRVHIAAGGFEPFKIVLRLPADAPATCEDNVWNVSIAWDTVAAGS